MKSFYLNAFAVFTKYSTVMAIIVAVLLISGCGNTPDIDSIL
jgi:outer membrane murein-binding lipoprotein Lpp